MQISRTLLQTHRKLKFSHHLPLQTVFDFSIVQAHSQAAAYLCFLVVPSLDVTLPATHPPSSSSVTESGITVCLSSIAR